MAQKDGTRAVDYLVQAAAIFAAYEDPQLEIALRVLARLRAAVGPARVARSLAAAVGVSEAEAAALLEGVGGGTAEGAEGDDDAEGLDIEQRSQWSQWVSGSRGQRSVGNYDADGMNR